MEFGGFIVDAYSISYKYIVMNGFITGILLAVEYCVEDCAE